MRMYLCFFLVLISLSGIAQSVEVSSPHRLTAKAGRFKIIGKNNDGIIVRLYGSEDIVHVYNDELKLTTTKTIQFKNQDGLTQYILLNKTGAVIYYLQQDKKQSVLYAQPVNSKFIEIGKPIAIDTIYDRKELIAQNLRFKTSADQNFTFIYYPFFAGSTVQLARFICIDHALHTHYVRNVPLDRNEIELENSRSLIDNEGNSYLILRKDTREEGELFDVFRVAEDGTVSKFTIAVDKDMFSEHMFEIDNKNGNLVLSAFYDEDGKRGEDAAHGFLYASFNPIHGDRLRYNLVPFPKTFMTTLTGRDMGEKGKLYTFNIKRAVLRNDGGVAVIAESFIKETRETSALGMQPGFNTFRTATVYQFNDIIAFSMNADGVLEWNTILRKKQISEDDNGAFSSFLIMNQKEKLRLLHLDDIATSATLTEQVLMSDGTTERRNVVNQDNYDLMLLPKAGKQITPDAVVIPSYRNGSLRLIKVTY